MCATSDKVEPSKLRHEKFQNAPDKEHPAQRGAVWSPEGGMAPKAGGPIPEKSEKKGRAQKSGAQKVGARRLRAPTGGGPKISRFFPYSAPNSARPPGFHKMTPESPNSHFG